MMRLPIPAILAALVVVAAGSVLVTTYFKSAEPYVLDLSGLGPNETKVVELNYIPAQIKFVSNDSNAVYEVVIYIDGTFTVTSPGAVEPHYEVYYNMYRNTFSNGTTIIIQPIEVKSTRVKIVATYT
jgi:hypothetical protein